MNRNYKVIWNEASNCFMAVAEYAKSCGKSSSTAVSSNGSAASQVTTGGARILQLSTLCVGLAVASLSMQATAVVFTIPGVNPITVDTDAAPTGGTITGLTNTTFDPNAVYSDGRAATEEQLQTVSDEVIKGVDFAGDSGADVNRQLGEKLAIVGGETVGANLTIGNNIGVVADGTSTLTIKLAKDVDLDIDGSVTVGNTVVDNSGVVIAGGPSMTSGGGIDAAGQVITGVGTGALNALSTEAVNGSQLFSTNAIVTANTAGSAANTANTATNTLSIATNVTNISANTSGVATNLANINTNTSSIATNVTNISANTSGVATNLANINTNTLSIATNVTNISANTSGVATNAAGVAANTAGIVTNTANILTNTTDIGVNATNISKGLDFGGDSGPDINRQLGNKITIRGGEINSANLSSGSNIGVVADGSSTLTIRLAKNVDLDADGSLTAGATSIDTNGLVNGSTTVNGSGVTIAGGPSMTTGGIDAGSQVISNVTSGGSTLSNAANIFDVQTAAAAAKTEVVAGTNVSVTNVPGGSGQNVYTIDAEKTTVSTTSPGLTVVGTPNSSTNVTDYAVDLSAGTVTSLGLADSAIQTVETQINGTAVKTITKSNNTANFTNVGSGNIVLSDNGGAINVDTAPILNLTSVITGGSTLDTNGLVNGNTTLNGSGVSIAGGPSMTTGGIYAGNQVITGVANGTAPNHAVNFGQLTTLGYRVDDVEDDANAGISSAMAMASLPQPYLSGKSMISGAMGTYNSEGAMAIGVSAITQDGRWVIKASASVDTQSNFGGSVGAGYQF